MDSLQPPNVEQQRGPAENHRKHHHAQAKVDRGGQEGGQGGRPAACEEPQKGEGRETGGGERWGSVLQVEDKASDTAKL